MRELHGFAGLSIIMSFEDDSNTESNGQGALNENQANENTNEALDSNFNATSHGERTENDTPSKSQTSSNMWCEICYKEILTLEAAIHCNSCQNDFHITCVSIALETSTECPMCKSDLLLSANQLSGDATDTAGDQTSKILQMGLEDAWPRELESKTVDLAFKEVILPTIWMLRGEEEMTISEIYQPLDLITLIVQPTGKSKQTYVKMIDSRDQIRYHAKSGGERHKFVTRMQNTRTFGDWRFTIETPLSSTEELVKIEIPFRLTDHVAVEYQIQVEIHEGPSGYVLLFHEQEDEMFKVIEEEEPEKIVVIPSIAEMEPEVIELPPDSAFPYINKDLPKLAIPVNEIHGIGPSYKKKLNAQEIEYVQDLLSFEAQELSDLIGVSTNKCRNWIAEARDIADDKTNPTYLSFKQKIEKEKELEEDVKALEEPVTKIDTKLVDLKIPVTEIKGIGPSYQKKLANLDIKFVHELIPYDAEDLSDKISVSEKKCIDWLLQARDMMDPSNEIHAQYAETVSKKEIAEEEVVDLITETLDIENKELPNLKIPITEISGIGPSYQKKFEKHDIIYVHHLLPFTEEQLSEKSAISTGRCKKWLEQAQDIANNPDNEIYNKFTN